MAEERERVEVWPAFVVVGAPAVLAGVLIVWWQIGAFSPQRPGLLLLGWLLGVFGWPLLLAGLVGVAVHGLPRPVARPSGEGGGLSDDDLAAIRSGGLEDRAEALRDLRRRRDAGEITEDEYERVRSAIQGG